MVTEENITSSKRTGRKEASDSKIGFELALKDGQAARGAVVQGAETRGCGVCVSACVCQGRG